MVEKRKEMCGKAGVGWRRGMGMGVGGRGGRRVESVGEGELS